LAGNPSKPGHIHVPAADLDAGLAARHEVNRKKLEVKCPSGRPAARDLKGLRVLCEKKGLRRAVAVTMSAEEFGLIPPEWKPAFSWTQILKIPAPALCLLTPILHSMECGDRM